MQVYDDGFQAESGCSILTLLGSGHLKPAWNLSVPNVQQRTPDDGQRRCPKHVEFYNRITRLVGYLKDNSVNDFIKVYSYIVLSTTCFGSNYVPSSGWLLFFTNSQYVSTIISLMTYNKNWKHPNIKTYCLLYRCRHKKVNKLPNDNIHRPNVTLLRK